MKLTAERLREVLRYDPDSGVFTWVVCASRRTKAGAVAGAIDKNRRIIRLDGTLHRANRLAWLYVTGEWPKQQIDHRDGDSLNDRFNNLRDVSNAVNAHNQRKAQRTNKLGLLGVVQTGRNRFKPQIVVHGKHVPLGTFETAELAHAAYIAAKRELHEGNTL